MSKTNDKHEDKPMFTINKQGWGSRWKAGNTITFLHGDNIAVNILNNSIIYNDIEYFTTEGSCKDCALTKECVLKEVPLCATFQQPNKHMIFKKDCQKYPDNVMKIIDDVRSIDEDTASYLESNLNGIYSYRKDAKDIKDLFCDLRDMTKGVCYWSLISRLIEKNKLNNLPRIDKGENPDAGELCRYKMFTLRCMSSDGLDCTECFLFDGEDCANDNVNCMTESRSQNDDVIFIMEEK